MAASPSYDSTGVESYRISSFTFQSGAKLDIDIKFRRFNPTASRTVLIPTCFGGLINGTQNFTKGALASYHVVVAAMIGNGESSSPNGDPDFPEVDYRDVINAHYGMLTEGLGIEKVDAVIGFSMGGQQAYHWAAKHGGKFVERVVAICSSARTSDHNYAFLEGPKSTLVNSSDFLDGKYKSEGVEPVKAVSGFGRTYVAWMFSQVWFREKTWKEAYGRIESMAEFMDQVAESRFAGWDPLNLLSLLRMWQKGDIAVYREDGDYQKALADIQIPVLLMPCRTDQYFPPEDSEIEMKYLSQGRLAVIESTWGHVAGGGANQPDASFMDNEIRKFLN